MSGEKKKEGERKEKREREINIGIVQKAYVFQSGNQFQMHLHIYVW